MSSGARKIKETTDLSQYKRRGQIHPQADTAQSHEAKEKLNKRCTSMAAIFHLYDLPL